MEKIPALVQIDYYLPNELELEVKQNHENILQQLSPRFPHERQGICRFYKECGKFFNCLNQMELLCLEEPRFLLEGWDKMADAGGKFKNINNFAITTMYLTWLDSNTWLIEIGGKRLLVDPWLVDSLVFGNFEWLFKGERHQDRPIPENIDLIVLSQGLDDHAHRPTLRQLDRNIPVVGSINAAKVVQELGYTSVTTLTPGETFTLDDSVLIEATAGSQIGPNTIENGYLFKEIASGLTLYYEPHGFHSLALKSVAPIDVVITPLTDLALPLIGAIIKGNQSALELAKWVQPQVMLPTAVAGEAFYSGLLFKILRTEGSLVEFQTLLAHNHLETQVIEPRPGERFQLQLKQRAVAS